MRPVGLGESADYLAVVILRKLRVMLKNVPLALAAGRQRPPGPAVHVAPVIASRGLSRETLIFK